MKNQEKWWIGTLALLGMYMMAGIELLGPELVLPGGDVVTPIPPLWRVFGLIVIAHAALTWAGWTKNLWEKLGK